MKRFSITCLIVISMLINLFAVPVFADTSYDSQTVSKIMDSTNVFDLKAKGAVLLDAATGNVLLEKDMNEKLPLASVTKVMSMLLLMEAIDSGKVSFDEKVHVSEHSYDMGGSQVWLKPGEEFTVDEMLKAVAVHSANDATVAIAEKVAGSEDVFVSLMNEKAKKLGMNNTNFLDCTGLTDEGHYSTAYDIALMSRELIMKHPKILEYTTIWHDKFRANDPKHTVDLDNTNKLIHFYKGANGLKTGFTTKAGHCLAASAKRNDMQLISVVLGEPDSNTRFAESRKLLDYGFANYELSQVNKKSEVVGEVVVKKGVESKVNAIYANDVNILLNKGSKGKVEREIKLEEGLTAPLEAGQKIGDVVYKIDGKEVGKTDLVAESKVDRASFIRLFFRMVIGWFGLGKG